MSKRSGLVPLRASGGFAGEMASDAETVYQTFHDTWYETPGLGGTRNVDGMRRAWGDVTLESDDGLVSERVPDTAMEDPYSFREWWDAGERSREERVVVTEDREVISGLPVASSLAGQRVLAGVPGIGRAKARAIVEHVRGGGDIEALARGAVKGIGPALAARVVGLVRGKAEVVRRESVEIVEVVRPRRGRYQLRTWHAFVLYADT